MILAESTTPNVESRITWMGYPVPIDQLTDYGYDDSVLTVSKDEDADILGGLH